MLCWAIFSYGFESGIAFYLSWFVFGRLTTLQPTLSSFLHNFTCCMFFMLFSNITFHFLWTEIESSKKQAEMDRKAIDDLVRERDILNKNLLKVERQPHFLFICWFGHLLFRWFLFSILLLVFHFFLHSCICIYSFCLCHSEHACHRTYNKGINETKVICYGWSDPLSDILHSMVAQLTCMIMVWY